MSKDPIGMTIRDSKMKDKISRHVVLPEFYDEIGELDNIMLTQG